MKTLLTFYFYFNKIFRSNSCDFYKIKSWLFTLGVITLGTAISWGQGNEDFSNIPTDNSSYSTHSWTGSDGVDWTATHARTDQTLNGRAICTRNLGKVTSPTYSGGMGTLTFNYVRGFTNSNERGIEVYVNGIQIGANIIVNSTSDVVVGYSSAINISGNVVLELRTTGAQVKIDDISWTSYGDPEDPGEPGGVNECIDEPIFSSLPTAWSTSGTQIPSLDQPANLEIGFNANSGWVVMKPINNPQSISFDLRRTTNSNAKTLYVEVATAGPGGPWTIVGTYNHDNTTHGGTTNVSVDLSAYSMSSAVYIRLRKASSTTSPWYVKNVIVDCGGGGTCIHTITNFTPANGPEGTIVTITGTGFTSTSTVNFNDIVAMTTFINATTLQAVVPAGATTGEITITENACDVLSSSDFIVNNVDGTCNSSGGNYQILIWNNGIENWDNSNYSLSLSGVIPNNTAWVIGCGTGTSSGTDNPTSNKIPFGFNKNERIVLYKNGIALDRFGTLGENNWMETGSNYSRNASVTTPTSSYNPGEWDINSYTTSSLGNHTFNESISDLIISEVADPNSGNNHYIEIYNGTGAPIDLENIVVNAPPTITAQPTISSSCMAASFNITASASNNGTLTYQWYYQDNNGGAWMPVSAISPVDLTISGFNTNSLTILNGNALTSTIHNYQFHCVVTEDGCSVYSNTTQFHYETNRYFRSVTSGDWTTISNWEVTNDLAGFWTPACAYPTASNSSKVFIENGTTIELDIDNDVDYLEIKNGGTLEVLPSSKLTVNDSTVGADFIINGTFLYRSNSSNSFSFGTNATWSLGSNATLIKTNTGGIATFRDNYEGGMANIPATADWIYRFNNDGDPTVGTIDFFYPNLSFENTTATAYSFGGNFNSFNGNTGFATVKGNFDIGVTGSSTCLVSNANFNVQPMLIYGNMHVDNGSGLVNYNTATTEFGTGFELKGDLLVDGTLSVLSGATERVFRFTGTTDQTVSGTGIIDLYKMTVNKTTGNVLLNRDLQAQNELVMAQGHIFTNTSLLELGLSTTQKGILNHTNDYVVGRMRRWFDGTNFGDQTGLYPMGYDDGGLKNRNTKIEFTTAPTAGGDLTVEFIGLDMTYAGLIIPAGNSGGFGSDITNAEDQGYWTCTAGSLSGGTYTSSYTGEGFSQIISLLDITLLKRQNASSPWTAPGVHIPAAGTTGLPTVSRSGLTGFSDFGFGSRNNENPLPIELISFSAVCNNEKEGLIQWKTATETNNDYFTIEKSTDGIEWHFVEKIKGKGNYSLQSNYSIKDRDINNEVTYYRLTQVDFNGDTETFHPISLICQTSTFYFQVFPNPANDFTTVSLQGYNFQNATLDLRTIEGKLIQRNLVFENTNSIHLNVNLNSLSQGIYLLHWTDGNGEKEVRKIVVK